MPPTFAEGLRLLRERAGLTQQELADRASLTPHAVSALERGVRTRPYPHTVRSLADALGASDAERSALLASVPRRSPTGTVGGTGDPVGPAGQPGDRDEPSPPDRSVAGLTVPATRLFGRSADLAAVASLVRQGERLVTLLGPGGVGKTRLAAAVVEQLAADFPDGVVQVSLGPILNAGDVAPTVARALGMSTATSGAGIAQEIGDRRMLLVLDNVEHLLSIGPDIGRLVASCPRLVVLTSSRSPLRVRDEREYPVSPLDLPDPGARTEAALARSAAGALVLDRARRHAPEAAFDAPQVASLVELCHRLAGLPLAIELATARLRALSPQVLVSRLEESMRVSGARDLPERQRTMRSTLDWSFDLLTSELQQLFTLMGAFRGGADLEAVEGVAGAALGIAPSDVLAQVEQLVEHSLVVVRPGATAIRYDLLEPVAQYARSRLVGDHADRVYRAHAHFFHDRTAAAARAYERDDAVEWLESIARDEANVVVAVERALDLGEPDLAGMTTYQTWLYWWLRGRHLVGLRVGRRCLQHPTAPQVRGRLHLAVAGLAYAADDLTTATREWDHALTLGTELDDAELLSKATAGGGLASLAAGEVDEARRQFDASIPWAVDDGERGLWIRSLAHIWLGTTYVLTGRLNEATVEVGRGAELARERGDRLCTYVALYNLAQIALARGDDDGARRHLDEGIALSVQTGDLSNIAYFVETAAVVQARSQHYDQVALLMGAVSGLRDVARSVFSYYIPDEELRGQAERSAREALGEDAYDDLVDSGRAMGLDEILRVLAEVRTHPPARTIDR